MPATNAAPRYNNGRTITVSDTVNIYPDGGLTDAVQFGEAGPVTVVWQDDSTTAMTVAAGDVYPIAIKRINDTGTTGTLFVGFRAV